MNGSELIPNQWSSLELGLDALSGPPTDLSAAQPGFDPTVIVAIGVSLVASSEVDTPIAMAIDTVTD